MAYMLIYMMSPAWREQNGSDSNILRYIFCFGQYKNYWSDLYIYKLYIDNYCKNSYLLMTLGVILYDWNDIFILPKLVK